MKSQSLKNLYQLIIRQILIITWNKRATFLSSNKYENIEQKERKRLLPIVNFFLITDIDKLVKPKERKE